MIKEHYPLDAHQKIYLASDFHLGAPDHPSSTEREKKIVRWLSAIETDAKAIILVGDVFDFWFEYKYVVPKGFVRFLGKLQQLSDKGITILIFTGNHDLWLKEYLEEELHITIIHQPKSIKLGPFASYLAHGDGLGPGDTKFKMIKRVFMNPLAQWGFKWLHPDVGIALARAWSQHSKDIQQGPKVRDHEDERLITHCKEIEQYTHHDLYIMGHRHLQLTEQIADNSTYYNLGDWIKDFTFMEISNERVSIQVFEG